MGCVEGRQLGCGGARYNEIKGHVKKKHAPTQRSTHIDHPFAKL